MYVCVYVFVCFFFWRVCMQAIACMRLLLSAETEMEAAEYS